MMQKIIVSNTFRSKWSVFSALFCVYFLKINIETVNLLIFTALCAWFHDDFHSKSTRFIIFYLKNYKKAF